MPAIRVNCCYRVMGGKGNLFADIDRGATCLVKRLPNCVLVVYCSFSLRPVTFVKSQ